MPARRRAVAVAAAALAGGVGLANHVAGSALSGPRATPLTPHATVREFLDTALVRHDAALVRHDAEGACEFLTLAERSRLGGPGGCARAVGRLGRRQQIRIGVRAAAGQVTVTGLGAPLVFRVVPLAVGERPQAVAPASSWRLASGAEGLLACCAS
jgi:hypothetical protein